MKKTITLLLTAAFLLTVVASFSGCKLFKSMTLDEAKANLEGAGYTVTVMTGQEYVDSDENTFGLTAAELENYLYASKGSDEIYLFFFVDVDTASRNYDFMIAPNKLLGGQSNKVVYFATRQARKDAKV